MKIRLRYKKVGDISYISHLDIIRMMERISNRAGVRLSYSMGFSPHPKTAFSSALPVGCESECEYLDLELEDEISVSELIAKYNKASVDGIEFLDGKIIEDKGESVVAFITHSRYEIVFYDEECIEDIENMFNNLKKSDKKVEFYRITKSGNKVIFDIKEYLSDIKIVKKDRKMLVVEMTLLQSSEKSLNPKIFFKFLRENLGKEDIIFKIKKIDTYNNTEGIITRPV